MTAAKMDVTAATAAGQAAGGRGGARGVAEASAVRCTPIVLERTRPLPDALCGNLIVVLGNKSG